MVVNGQFGMLELLGMLKDMNSNTLRAMLDKTNLTEQDKQEICALFTQYNQDKKLEDKNKQNAINVIQKLIQRSKMEGQQENVEKIFDKISKNSNLSAEDKNLINELKKPSK